MKAGDGDFIYEPKVNRPCTLNSVSSAGGSRWLVVQEVKPVQGSLKVDRCQVWLSKLWLRLLLPIQCCLVTLPLQQMMSQRVGSRRPASAEVEGALESYRRKEQRAKKYLWGFFLLEILLVNQKSALSVGEQF